MAEGEEAEREAETLRTTDMVTAIGVAWRARRSRGKEGAAGSFLRAWWDELRSRDYAEGKSLGLGHGLGGAIGMGQIEGG